jgi:hypothetical protein
VNAAEAVEGSVRLSGYASALACSEDYVQAFDHERGMSAFRGSEIGLDAEMKIYAAGHEPDAFTLCHLRRFFDFSKAEDTGIEGASAAFTSDGDGDLHVVNMQNWHGGLRRFFRAARLNFPDGATQTLTGGAHFVLHLQIHPKLFGRVEETSQSNGGIRCDAAPL